MMANVRGQKRQSSRLLPLQLKRLLPLFGTDRMPSSTTLHTRRGLWRVAAVLMPLLLLLLSVSCYLGESTWPNTTFFNYRQAEMPTATQLCMDGVVTVQPGGRLGNLLMEYSCSAILADRHHLRLAMPTQILEPLSAIFHNLSAEPLGHILQQPPCEGLNLTEQEFLDDPKHQLLTWGPVEKTLKLLRSKHLPLIFQRYMLRPEYLAPSLDFLRQQFRFRSEIQKVANEKLQKIRLETAEATGTNYTQVCAIGVHVRRTDYGEFLLKKVNLKEMAGVSYYEAAAAAMLKDLHSECAAVAFAVTSDDNEWCQHNLLPVLTINASEVSPPSVGFLMSSETPADDLCLLSSCQHLIMTYGTFGLSAAILCKGRTIMYDAIQHGAKEMPLPQRMVTMVPGWRLIA